MFSLLPEVPRIGVENTRSGPRTGENVESSLESPEPQKPPRPVISRSEDRGTVLLETQSVEEFDSDLSLEKADVEPGVKRTDMRSSSPDGENAIVGEARGVLSDEEEDIFQCQEGEFVNTVISRAGSREESGGGREIRGFRGDEKSEVRKSGGYAGSQTSDVPDVYTEYREHYYHR